MEAIVELYLLGPVQLKYCGQPVYGFESRKALALLCYLAAQKHPVLRTHLTHLFWGDKDEKRARSNLSRVLHNNAALLPGCLEITRDTVAFKPTVATFVDIDFFLELTKGQHIQSFVEAMECYRGHFMADIIPKDCPEFEAWLITEQELWNRRIANVLQLLITHYKNSGDYEQGIKFAAQFLAQDSWREEIHREMMLMLALSGQRAAALAQYEKCCDLLDKELGVNPSAETMALYYRIRNGEIRSKQSPAHVAGYRAPVTHQPTPMLPAWSSTTISHQATAPCLSPLSICEDACTSIAEQKISEFMQIVERLANPICHLLTLVGPNNDVQKRLLVEVMNGLSKTFRHGVCFVTNRGSSSHSLLADIAYSLNLAESDLTWDEGERAYVWLFKQLREKELLLVISDIERYRESLVLLEEILKRAPMVKLLVSAQTPLSLHTEWIFDIY